VSGIRLVVVDDNPHVRWNGRVHPVNATFHAFLSAVLDVPGRPVASIRHIVPLREADADPRTRPVDERIEVVGSAPFDGIAGFLRHARSISRANRPLLEREIEAADLLWLKVPASNAMLAARVAGRSGTPRFGWVAGSARRVGASLPGNPLARLGAVAVGTVYDVAGRLAAGPKRIVVGRGVVGRGGIVASLVTPDELRPPAAGWSASSPIRIAWAGRVAEAKGLGRLLDTLLALPDARLVMLGSGPARQRVEAAAGRLGVGDRIEWRGYVADRGAYLDALAEADVLLHPSPAEGFPKVVLDAMAVGLPVAATPAGALDELARARLIVPVARKTRADPAAYAVMSIVRDPAATQAMRLRAADFAAEHTAPAEAARLVGRLREWFPGLDWGATG
jgi:glycosyltransferase involved in cell wall biosynthesis